MIKSMTAYGRSSLSTSKGQWSLEIHSVNRKLLDINIFLPKELLRFDIELRKWIASNVSRGQISLRVHFAPDQIGLSAIKACVVPLQAAKAAWEKIAEELGYDPLTAIDLKFLLDRSPITAPSELEENEKEVLDVLKKLFNIAVQQLIAMKELEGDHLAKDISLRVSQMEQVLAQIAKLSEGSSEKYRKKLMERIQEVSASKAELDDRILKEVAIFAEKQDVTEELVRLKSHFQQFRNLLSTPERCIGRTLDFLTQEINREINTIASKCSDSEVAQLTVNFKSELEKIREQTQNIE